MMIKEASLREDPDLRGELAFLARGCDFVLPSRFKKRLKSFQQAQVSSQPLVQQRMPCLTLTCQTRQTIHRQIPKCLLIGQWKGVRQGRNTVSKCCVQELRRGGRKWTGRDGLEPQLLSSKRPCRPAPLAVEFSKIQSHFNSSLSVWLTVRLCCSEISCLRCALSL